LIPQTEKVLEAIQKLLAGHDVPLVIALDGPSGAGKSTIAAALAPELDIAIVPLDDFFSAHIPDHKWDEFTLEEKLKCVIDWGRVRAEAILPLLQGKPARWHAFDFQGGLRADGTYSMEKEARERKPAQVILIEGAYSAGPALANLVDFTILIDAPLHERHARIAKREDPDFLKIWHRRWDAAEEYYFGVIRPKHSFDLVVLSE
jgi:uridine kinase